ncbi:hypothetical protein [Aquimarina celericrescens]|uniref:Uncharacterized protein n=1 Tax=Aquimarina celericrescens TaxID=1964542 RepID=A0ABW5AU20_9FLAO|nr:hypothetical protein [Aquimarina celericrescens]
MKSKYILLLSFISLLHSYTFSQELAINENPESLLESGLNNNSSSNERLINSKSRNSGDRSGNENPKDIETVVMTIDLDDPRKKSVKMSNDRSRLAILSRELLAVKLINGNPFRYQYKLNYQSVNLFDDKQYIPDFNRESTSDTNIPEIQLIVSGRLETDPLKSLFIIDSLMTKLEVEIRNFVDLNSQKTSLNLDEFRDKRREFKDKYEEYLILWNTQESKLDPQGNYPDLPKLKKSFLENKEKIRVMIERLLSVDNKPYLLPIDINGDNIDYIEIELEIYDKTQQTTRKYTYKIWITGGLKIDFSGGVTVTSLFDSEYTTVAISDDPATTENEAGTAIRELDNGDYDFGFGAMVNISIRSGGAWVKPSLSIGAMFSSEQKFQLMTGFGLILGKNSRFIFHGGLAMGQVATLRSDFVADGETTYNLGEDGSIPTNDKFEFGHFFGISYNFGNPKAKTPAQ